MANTKEQEQQQPEQEGPRSFAVLLQQIDDGGLHADLSAQMHALVQHLYDRSLATNSKSKGELTLKLSIATEANGIASIVSEVKTKTPKPNSASAVFWITKGNNLSPENPRQRKLPLHEAPAAPKARDIADEARPAKSV